MSSIEAGTVSSAMNRGLSLAVLCASLARSVRRVNQKILISSSVLLLAHNNLDKVGKIQYFNHEDPELFNAGPIDEVINPRHTTDQPLYSGREVPVP